MKKFVACLLLVPCVASAEFWTGNDFYNRITSHDVMDRVQAMGYVTGVYDVAVHVWFCPSSERGVTVGQISDIAKNWLANNPHRRNESAERLLRTAFGQVWPCAKSNNKGGV